MPALELCLWSFQGRGPAGGFTLPGRISLQPLAFHKTIKGILLVVWKSSRPGGGSFLESRVRGGLGGKEGSLAPLPAGGKDLEWSAADTWQGVLNGEGAEMVGERRASD